jgi:glycosyltransferase involved in cell wall biosynthesis
VYPDKKLLLCDPMNPPYSEALLWAGPLGGSETVFLLLAKELSKLCDLTVGFGDQIPKILSEQDFDAVISYRSPEPLTMVENSKGYLFCQDMPGPMGIQFINQVAIKIAKFIFLSHYQKEAYLPQLKTFEEGRNVIMLENGIDLELFDSSIQKENSFLYASAPNRGLDVLLEIWPVLYRMLPDWTLKIAGSTSMYNVPDSKDNESRMELLSPGTDLYLRASKMEGVTLLGGLTYEELVWQMESCKALLYPCTFPETCCHVVNNALHAGCVPITSATGALVEKITNGENGLIVNGDPHSDQFKGEFVKTVTGIIQSGSLERMIRTNRGMYIGYDIARQAKHLLLHVFGHDDFEGLSYRIFAVCCSLRGNQKRQFSNLKWYSPLDVITDEIVGLPIDQARNAAANMAVCNGSDYLMMLDDDIYTSSTFVQDMLRLMIKNSADVVVANYYYKEDSELVPVTRIVETSFNQAIIFDFPSDQDLNSDKYRFVTSGAGAMLIRTEALKKIGRPYFRTQNTMAFKHTGEDSYFYQQCYLLGLKIYITNEIPIIHVGNGKCYGKPEFLHLASGR